MRVFLGLLLLIKDAASRYFYLSYSSIRNGEVGHVLPRFIGGAI